MLRFGLVPLALLLAFASPATATLGPTSLVSVSTGTSGGNDTTFALDAAGLKEAVTPDGHYMAFVDRSSNLSSTPDANGTYDVFWRDLETGQTKLVSINSAGSAAGNFNSQEPGISDDGRYVVFSSSSNNLVAGYTGSNVQIYVRDMQNGTTALVSRTTGSATAGGNNASRVPLISANGQVVVWMGKPTDVETPDIVSGSITHDQLYARDLQSGVTSIVTDTPDHAAIGDGDFTDHAVLTPDGRYVAFSTGSKNLVTGYTSLASGGITEVYRRDLQTATTTLVSATTTGPTEGTTGTNGIFQPGISDDGRYVAFDGNGVNMVAGFTDHDGLGGYDVYLRDVTAGTTSLVSGTSASSTGNSFSDIPRLTGDGRYVMFTTFASDLVAGDTNGHADLVRWDRTTGTRVAVDAADAGTVPATGGSGIESGGTGPISADGNLVAFAIDAPNMVAGLTSGGLNVYLRDITAHTTQLISSVPGSSTAAGNQNSHNVWMSANGARVLWTSAATDLIASFGNLNTTDEDFYARATSTPPPPTDGGGGGGGGGGDAPTGGDPPPTDNGLIPPASSNPPGGSDPKPNPPKKSGKCKKGHHRKGKKCVKNKPKRHRSHKAKAKKPGHKH